MSHPSPPPAPSAALPQPAELLQRALESDRVHSAYLLSGPGEGPREAALEFARGLACTGGGDRPCGDCRSCRISTSDAPPLELLAKGKGKERPSRLYRHIADHPDLLWVEQCTDKTRIIVEQIRELQKALRLGANEGGWRAGVITGAEAMNQDSQNGLLKLLEEPPPRTCLILVSASPAGLLATIRSRCQRVIFPMSPPALLHQAELPDEQRSLVPRFDTISTTGLVELLDWAGEYRGNRATVAEKVEILLEVGSEWLRERVLSELEGESSALRGKLDAYKTLADCRRDLIQRNANPVMIAERALFAVRQSFPSGGGARR
jgi:DNA polymerase-3 subunit delta'